METKNYTFDFNAGRHWEGQYRDAKGRFCTKDTYKVEKVANENKRLRLENEKYTRMYLALAKEYSRVLRENEILKSSKNNN